MNIVTSGIRLVGILITNWSQKHMYLTFCLYWKHHIPNTSNNWTMITSVFVETSTGKILNKIITGCVTNELVPCYRLWLDSVQVNVFKRMKIESRVAVSYTHLDVYKRQVVCAIKHRPFFNSNINYWTFNRKILRLHSLVTAS